MKWDWRLLQRDYVRWGLASYISSVIGLLAGYLLYIGSSDITPAVASIIPILLGLRGAVSGVFSGRLTTALHLGLVKPSLIKPSPHLYTILATTLVIGYTAIMTPMLSMALVLYLAGAPITHQVYTVPVLVITLGMGFTIPFQTVFGGYVSRRGLDPDIYLYPWTSNVSDIVIALLLIWSINLDRGISTYLAATLLLLYSIATFYAIYNSIWGELWRSVREALYAVSSAALLTFFGGMALSSVHKGLEEIPSIYIVIPPLLSLLGSFISTLGSVYTTSLRRYGLDKADKDFMVAMSSLLISSMMVSLVIAMPTWVLTRDYSTYLLLILAYLSSALVLIPPAYYIARVAWIRGLDPDNLVIPLSTSLADLVMTIAISAAIFILG